MKQQQAVEIKNGELGAEIYGTFNSIIVCLKN